MEPGKPLVPGQRNVLWELAGSGAGEEQGAGDQLEGCWELSRRRGCVRVWARRKKQVGF